MYKSGTPHDIAIETLMAGFKQALGTEDSVYGLHEPCFRGNEKKYLAECIDTGWVSSVGKFVDRFERELAEYVGAKHAIATVNGTAALHIALLLAGVSSRDEVLVPALSFVATANAVAYCGGTPHFVDSSWSTLGIDPSALTAYLDEICEVTPNGCFNLLTGKPIKALVPMHTFGHPVDMPPLVELCKKYRLALLEDAAESLGSFSYGKHTGNWGMSAAFSFNGNKIATTGGGGAFVTNDSKLATQAKHLTTTAKCPHPFRFFHDMTGYNYRMPNINAALGVAQLEQLPEFIAAKRMLAERYKKVFDPLPGVTFFNEPPNCSSNYWLNVLLLDQQFASQKDEILDATNKAGIMTRPAWTLLSRLPMYQDCPRAPLPVAEALEQCLINIPSSSFLCERKEALS